MAELFTLELTGETNPGGLFLKMWSMELGFTQNQLAKTLGIKQAAIAKHFSRDGKAPSFATNVGGDLTELLLEEERNQWVSRWGDGSSSDPRRYPSSRPRVVRQSLFILSHLGRRGASEKARTEKTRTAGADGMRNLEFKELMTFASPEVVQEMTQMMHAPFYGALMKKPEGYDRRKVVSQKLGYDPKFLERFKGAMHQARQEIGRTIFRAEREFASQEADRVRRLLAEVPSGATAQDVRAKMTVAERAEEDAGDPGYLYDSEVIALARAGETGKVLTRIAQRYEGWKDWKQERDEAAWEAAEALQRITTAAGVQARS